MITKIFIAYSHHDKQYLEEASLFGHLRGLEQEWVAKFWYDERITTGDLWDEEIKRNISECKIALLLVSELFLNSSYVRKTEIPHFLKKRKDEGMIIFPVILSECDWKTQVWLSQTQSLPRDGRNIESHYSEPGPQKALFLDIKRDLRQQIDRLPTKAFSISPASEAEDHSEQPPFDEKSSLLTNGEEWTNPFDWVTANDLRYEDIPHLFVSEYTDFNTIRKHFDTILEGQRGTGKTMILRYMAYETQIKIWKGNNKKPPQQFGREPSNYIGIYCRLEQGVFDRSDLDAIESGDRKERLFEHRLSLFCLAQILKTLNSILAFLQVSPEILNSLKQRISNILKEPQIVGCLTWTETYNYSQETINCLVADEDIHLGSILPGGNPTTFNPWLTLSSPIVPFLEFIHTTLALRCPFFLMLDDFDVLRQSQQIAVFRTASARKIEIVCFKYGIMTLGKKATVSGSQRTYRDGDDYDRVSLDWPDKGLQTDYKKAVELITSKRLEAKLWPIGQSFSDILAPWKRGEELREAVKEQMRTEWNTLPKRKRPETFDNFWSKYGEAKYFQYLAKKKIRHRYAGYDTVIDISSGIYRQYLEICSRVVAKALATEWKPDAQKSITAEVQDDAIREYSREMMDSLSVTAGDTTALLSGDISVTSKHMVTFIQSLSELFKKRLHSELRDADIFCISIRDDLESNSKAKAILDVAVRESILHRRSADYTPKTAGGPPLPTYMLNRRLAPRGGLGVRMHGRIEMLSSDIVLASEDKTAFIKKYAKQQDSQLNVNDSKLF